MGGLKETKKSQGQLSGGKEELDLREEKGRLEEGVRPYRNAEGRAGEGSADETRLGAAGKEETPIINLNAVCQFR